MTSDPIRQLGIIGVGHLATFLVEGLHRVEREFDVVLSPRNLEVSRELADRFGTRIATDNQSLVDCCDVLVISLRSDTARETLQALQFSPQQIVVSVMAGVSLETLAEMVAPATPVRSMPVSSAAIGQSPTVIFPMHDKVAHLFEFIGSVHPAADEEMFDRLSMIGGYYAWLFALFADSIEWFADSEASTESARELVLQSVLGAANMALASPDPNLRDVLSRLATPGGITERGLLVLREQGALDAWQAALQAAHDKFRNNE